MKPEFDKVYQEWVIPWKCPCCKQYWMVVKDGKLKWCVHGGPYLGYIEIKDKS